MRAVLALAAAILAEVRAYYQRIGFDMLGALKRWGVTMMRADYEAPAQLQ